MRRAACNASASSSHLVCRKNNGYRPNEFHHTKVLPQFSQGRRQAVLTFPFLLWSGAAEASVANFQGSNILGVRPFWTGNPKPVTIPRRKLNVNFAVLLLRSGYDAAEELDFVDMTKFQKSFWLLRQNRWETYRNDSPQAIRQGDLSDPLYFDFISAMQVTTIGKCIDESTNLPSTELSVGERSQLKNSWERITGQKIFNGIVQGFRGENFIEEPLPAIVGNEATRDELVKIVQYLVDTFVHEGFAIEGHVAKTDEGFTVKLKGPANLWAISEMSKGNDYSSLPLYDVFAIEACLQSYGIQSLKCDVMLSSDNFSLQERWSIA